MKLAFRNACATFSRRSILNPNNKNPTFTPLFPLLPALRKTLPASVSLSRNVSSRSFASSSTPPMAAVDAAIETQFEKFRSQLEDSGSLRERIRNVAMEIESVTRLMHAGLLLVHQSRPVPEVLDKVKAQIGKLKELFNQLAEILQDHPGQFYRYHKDWRTETQTVVSLLAFMHWLETGSLLLHSEAEVKLELNSSVFGLDTEDYLVGICFMSNELPRYVVNQVTSGDYDCPRKVLNFLTDLHAAFRMLNLRNDFLRKKFDGMKYDLKRVEEVYYDVKIRGLAVTSDSNGDQSIQAQP
ncbi:hypothetical protein V2J09_006654 [Rumex salicifolius]